MTAIECQAASACNTDGHSVLQSGTCTSEGKSTDDKTLDERNARYQVKLDSLLAQGSYQPVTDTAPVKAVDEIDEAERICKGQLSAAPEVGTSEVYFRTCTSLARFTPLAHRIDTEADGVPLRLYVFLDPLHSRVYVVNHVIIAVANVQTPIERQAGFLYAIGDNPVSRDTPRVVQIDSDGLLAYGVEPKTRWDTSDLLAFRDLLLPADNKPSPPFQWDQESNTWKKLTLPPQCQGVASLYTATTLPDKRVLIAGGLCAAPGMAGKSGSYIGYKKLSIFNPEKSTWEAAPELRQGRIFHTASLLQDGSVLIAGGISDQLLSGTGSAALNSVELYANGKVLSRHAMITGRAKHAATVLKDGSVLVVGGVDAQGKTLASAEKYEPDSDSWHSVASMHQPRFNHTAVLLADGLVMVIGGVDEKQQVLDNVEIYDPKTSLWSQGPSLPANVRAESALQLANGDVLVADGSAAERTGLVTWAYLLRQGDKKWLPAGLAQSNELAFHPVMRLSGNGRVMITGSRHVFEWMEHVGREQYVAPRWTSSPSATVLPGGGVMAVGPVDGLGKNWNALIWDQASGIWSFAGQLNFQGDGYSKATTLPSGQVLVVAGYKFNQAGMPYLECETVMPGDLTWKSCGTIAVQSSISGLVSLKVMPDKQVVLVANSSEAFAYDQSRNEWSQESIDYLPAMPSSIMAARNGAPSSWTFAALPDGCILSWPGLRLFDPQTGATTQLSNLAQNVSTTDSDMLALPDGTVVILGVATDEKEPGFFARKASCDGFAAKPENVPGQNIPKVDRTHSQSQCLSDPTQCIDPVKKLPPRDMNVPGKSKYAEPRIPCMYVGTWKWRNGSMRYQFDLRDDGTYAIVDESGVRYPDFGHWFVQGDYTVWRSKYYNPGLDDVNKIIPGDRAHFQVIERDGSLSSFELIRAKSSSTCSPS